jgi:hypothetical protein
VVQFLGISIEISPDLEPRKRFYQTYQLWMSDTLGSVIPAIESIGQHIQNMVANTIAPIQQINYAAMVSPILDALKDINKNLYENMQEFAQSISKSLIHLTDELQETYKAAELNAEVVGPILSQANLWIPPSAPLSLLFALGKLIEEENSTSETVERLFIKFYKENDWAALRNMVYSWEENPHFANRMPIIFDALQAHIDGAYTLSIPALLPHA